MKNLIYVLLIGLSFTACKGPGGDKAKVSEVQDKAEASAAANDVAVDLANSKVTWVGSKPAGSHNGIIKLGDFGFCKNLNSADEMTKTMLGSPIYMAPEVLKG